MRAKYRRIAVSIYLDFLLVYGVVAVFLFLSGLGIDYALLTSVAVTLLARAVLHRAAASPGMHMMGIGPEYLVDNEIAARESWLTVLLGTTMVWGGMEEALRWIELPFPVPYFGFVAGVGLDIPIALAHGLLYVAAGWLVLRLSRWGLWLGLGLGLADACSTLLSWDLWDRLVPFWVAYRRQAQGLPVMPGEMEFMQSLLPGLVLGITLLAVLGLLASWRRFASSGPRLQPNSSP